MKRLAVRLALAVAAVAAGGVSALVACASFGAEDAPKSDAAAAPDADAPDADGGSPDPDGSFEDSPPVFLPVCPDAADFCDSFDTPKPLPRDWSKVSAAGATISLLPGAGVKASGGLVIAADAGNSNKFALLELKPLACVDQYRLVLAFSARVRRIEGKMLGPRFFSVNAASKRRDVIVSFESGTVTLSDYTEGCDDNACPPINPRPVNIDAEWHRYIFTLKVHPATTASDYGEATLQIDDVVALQAKVRFSLSRPTECGMHVGLTYSLASTGADVAFDDVSLQLTPR